mgnify:CR=1 FL=1
MVILFEPQPQEFFLKDNAPKRLMRLREKLQGLKKLGIEYVCCIPFNPSFASLSREDLSLIHI